MKVACFFEPSNNSRANLSAHGDEQTKGLPALNIYVQKILLMRARSLLLHINGNEIFSFLDRETASLRKNRCVRDHLQVGKKSDKAVNVSSKHSCVHVSIIYLRIFILCMIRERERERERECALCMDWFAKYFRATAFSS